MCRIVTKVKFPILLNGFQVAKIFEIGLFLYFG